MEDKREKALRTEKVPVLIMKFAAPAILSMVINTIYNAVDSMYMGMIGTNALGAASVSFPFVLITGAIGAGLGIGGATYKSRLLGKKDKDGATSVISTVVITTILIGIVYSALGAVFTPQIVRILGATAELRSDSITYLRIIAIGSVFFMVNTVLINHLRGEGSALYALLTGAIGAVLNIILDPIFMFGLNMGVAGAAIATDLSLLIGSIIGLSFYISNKTVLKIRLSSVKFKKKMFAEILKSGIPAFFQQFLIAVISIVFISYAAQLGNHIVAAAGAYYKLYFVGMSVVIGLGFGIMPIIGFNYGAKLFSRVKQTVFYAYSFAIIYGVLIMLASQFLARPIAGLFSNDMNVLEPLTYGVRALGFAQLFFAFYFISQALFLALGEGKKALVMTLLKEGIFPVISITVLINLFNIEGLMSSMTLTVALAMLVSVFLVIPSIKLLTRKNADENNPSDIKKTLDKLNENVHTA